jgi:hypothetical protein
VGLVNDKAQGNKQVIYLHHPQVIKLALALSLEGMCLEVKGQEVETIRVMLTNLRAGGFIHM